MYSSKSLDELVSLSKRMGDKLDVDLKILDVTILETIKGAKIEDKSSIEELRSITQQAINFAKNGDSDKATEILNKFKNGRKNNK